MKKVAVIMGATATAPVVKSLQQLEGFSHPLELTFSAPTAPRHRRRSLAKTPGRRASAQSSPPQAWRPSGGAFAGNCTLP